MRSLQAQIIAQLGVKSVIDPAGEVAARVDFLVDYLQFTKAKGYVLGISGGVDSTLGGRLAQLAVEKVRALGGDAKFMAVRLPYLTQQDEADAQAALDFIVPDITITLNIAEATQGLSASYHAATGVPLSDFNKGNVKARLRMVAQYALAGDAQMLVVGTDHAAEAITGFYTKFGDGGADVMPLAGLAKKQVRELVAYLGGSKNVVEKMPTADLLDGKPGRADEEELGISYTDIDAYLCGEDVPVAVANQLENYFMRTRHKRTMPVTPQDTWWR